MPTLPDILVEPAALPTERILEARTRLQLVLQGWFPELDSAPNTPLGDLIITPDAVLLAQIETGLGQLLSDLDLREVERGNIKNEDFVRAYLQNLGLNADTATPATGVMRLLFKANRSYAIDPGAVFTFNGSEFRINAAEGDPVLIHPVGTPAVRRPLTPVGVGEYVVHLPVSGTAGAAVANGTLASHTLTHAELLSISAAGDFDPGTPVESLPDLARRARRTFASSTLTSRSGALSFLTRRWPRLIGASTVLSGDREMLRSGNNPLGVAGGTMDIYIRSQLRYAFAEATLPLTYDSESRAWVGALTLPAVPAFFALDQGVFQATNFLNNRGRNRVYSRSLNAWTDNLGVAYSNQEQLGIAIDTETPNDFSPAVNSEVTALLSNGTRLEMAGEYRGSVFTRQTERNLTLRLSNLAELDGVLMLQANVHDELSGETGTVYFAPNDIDQPKTGVLVQTGTDYVRLFNGLSLTLQPQGGHFDPSALLGLVFQMSFKGKTARFTVNYLYDPMQIQVESVVQNPDNRPLGVDVWVKSFAICHVTAFTVNYQIRAGSTLDQAAAQADIFDYVNGLAYPGVYEESEIGRILIRHGADHLLGVNKKGLFYPSLANVFVGADGVETAIPRLATTTLLPPVSDAGVGARNITYLLEAGTVQFHGQVV
jgi:hypothetical protein